MWLSSRGSILFACYLLCAGRSAGAQVRHEQ